MVSVKEKASLKGSGKNQGDERKRTIDEVSKSGDVVKTGDSSRSSGRARKRPAYCPGGGRHKDGMNLIQAFARNVGCAGRSLCYLAGESPVRLKLSERAGSESCERHGNRAFEA